jgi:hypothetical protein
MYRIPEPPKPKPVKPKLKLRTARVVFKKASAEGRRLRYYKPQSIRCNRVERLHVRCRGRWIYRQVVDGQKYSYRLKGAGWVKKSGRDYTAKIIFRVRITTPADSFTSPPDTEWGFYRVR